MSAIEGLLYGFEVLFTYQNILAALLGALIGTLVGVLPGIGPVAGVAIVLPITFSFGPVTGLIMMSGIFYGSMYGGSTTAILINMPGEAASAVTAIDGYQLTKKGRAGAVLAIVAVGSFVGGTLSIIGVMLFSPLLSQTAIYFGPAEFFALTAGGLLAMARISGGALAFGLFSMALGLLLGTIGQEAVTGASRYTFSLISLAQGISIVPVVVGLYGIAEILIVSEDLARRPKAVSVRLRDMLPTREEWKRAITPWIRGTGVGFAFGLLPGPAATLASFVSYRVEKAVSKNRDEIGEGAIEGVAGPETANNAAATATMVPLLALGIPFAPITALFIAALMVQGVQPGPLLISQRPDIFWGVIASMYLGNVMLLVLNLPLIGLWVSILRIPLYLFLPGILVLTIIGTLSVHGSMFDVVVLLGSGLLGYLLKKADLPLSPLIVGLILGPAIEKNFREALFLSQGDLGYLFSSWLAIAIWIIVALILASDLRRTFAGRRFAEAAKQAELE